MVERKYLDVNVFIYWLAGNGEQLEKAKNWIKKVEKSSKGEYITSTLTLYEILVIIAGLHGKTLKDIEFVRNVLEAIRLLDKLKLAPLSKDIISNVDKTMEKYGLDFEDSIHYLTAKKHDVVKIISNDRDFDKTELERIF